MLSLKQTGLALITAGVISLGTEYVFFDNLNPHSSTFRYAYRAGYISRQAYRAEVERKLPLFYDYIEQPNSRPMIATSILGLGLALMSQSSMLRRKV